MSWFPSVAAVLVVGPHFIFDFFTWWRHQMETFSALLALCEGNLPVTGEFPSQKPVTRSFDVFFYMRWYKRLSKPLRRHLRRHRAHYGVTVMKHTFMMYMHPAFSWRDDMETQNEMEYFNVMDNNVPWVEQYMKLYIGDLKSLCTTINHRFRISSKFLLFVAPQMCHTKRHCVKVLCMYGVVMNDGFRVQIDMHGNYWEIIYFFVALDESLTRFI